MRRSAPRVTDFDARKRLADFTHLARQLPRVRQDKVAAMRRAIASGQYDADEHIEAILDDLTADLDLLPPPRTRDNGCSERPSSAAKRSGGLPHPPFGT